MRLFSLVSGALCSMLWACAPTGEVGLQGEEDPSGPLTDTSREQPSSGPLPAPKSRDTSQPPIDGDGFSSPPGDVPGKPSPTPASPSPSPAPQSPPAATPPAAQQDPFEPARAFCVQRINQYRATLGLPALARAPQAEPCVDRQARYDAASRTAHGAFSACGEFAQNECPGWGGPLTSALPGCLAAMWSEGPGGGHYENMASTRYQYVACGIVQTQSGWWVIQDFR